MKTDNDKLCRIVTFDRHNFQQSKLWQKIWCDHQFESWADARGWLWDKYKAEVFSINGGFKIEFKYIEDAVLFKMTWL